MYSVDPARVDHVHTVYLAAWNPHVSATVAARRAHPLITLCILCILAPIRRLFWPPACTNLRPDMGQSVPPNGPLTASDRAPILPHPVPIFGTDFVPGWSIPRIPSPSISSPFGAHPVPFLCPQMVHTALKPEANLLPIWGSILAHKLPASRHRFGAHPCPVYGPLLPLLLPVRTSPEPSRKGREAGP